MPLSILLRDAASLRVGIYHLLYNRKLFPERKQLSVQQIFHLLAGRARSGSDDGFSQSRAKLNRGPDAASTYEGQFNT
jgi:hypothetical protein